MMKNGLVIGSWLALLATPSLVLAVLSINYALVTPACERQSGIELHVVAGTGLLLSLLLTMLARRNARQYDQNGNIEEARRRFVARVATLVGLLSSLAIVAQWLPI
jgi:membrane protein implicated in regulation of membrane protease activity